MAIVLECINVIVRKTTLEAKYPGGLAQYTVDCPNMTFREDEHLTRVGFMDGDEAHDFAKSLENNGLVYKRTLIPNEKIDILKLLLRKQFSHQYVDIAIVDMLGGISAGMKCDWLAVRRYSGKPGRAGEAACWLKGTKL